MSASILKTIDKAIELLWAIAHGAGSSSVHELAAQVRLPKSTTYRFLKKLQTKGFVDPSTEHGKYRLGSALLQLLQNTSKNGSLREQAVPVMQRLTAETGETTFLCIKTGQETTCIECIESPQPIITRHVVGKVRPLHVGAASKVMLAFLPSPEIEAVLRGKLSRVTKNTITDPTKLRKEIEEIREKGHAYSDQEFIIGARAVAAPIFDEIGSIIASLTLSAPIPRLGNSNRERLAARLVKGGQKISTSMGWKPERSPR